jgi:hypothetical protein
MGIVKPSRELENGIVEEEEFLSERYSFSRWIVDGAERIKEQIKKIKVIVPLDTNLESALERNYIQELGKTRGLDVTSVYLSAGDQYSKQEE